MFFTCVMFLRRQTRDHLRKHKRVLDTQNMSVWKTSMNGLCEQVTIRTNKINIYPSS